MRPKTISEQLMFNTVRIVTRDGSTGTGFFYNFKINDKIFPTIITNKHVINDDPHAEVSFLLHTDSVNDFALGNISITLITEWIFHPSKDMCFCFAEPIFQQIKHKSGKNIFYIANDESIIANQEKLDTLTALEELVMIGYPIGLWDTQNNYPIFRRGYTASHPSADFNEKGIALADIACFPGSSGSPIYILNETGYSDRNGNTFLGAQRLILLGILFAGPRYSAEGEVFYENIPTKIQRVSKTLIMANLGYYIKAAEINEFRDYIANKFP